MVTSTERPGRPRVEVLTDPAAFEDLGPEWDQLLGRSSGAHPYLSRPWAQAWWAAFGQGPRRAASRSTLHIVVIRRDGALVALAPLLSLRIGAGKASLRMLVGIGQENADYGGVLVARDDPGALGAVVEHLVGEIGVGRTVLNLTRLVEGNRLLGALHTAIDPAHLALREVEAEEYHQLDLTRFSDPAGEVRRLQRRNDVLRRRRRLGETGEVGFVYHHADPAGAGLDEFLRVHDLRWRGRSATGPFASEPGRRFLRDVTARLDAAGMLRLSMLTVDQVCIAARYGTVFGGWYQGMKSAWDPRYASVAPGHLLVGSLLEQIVEEGLDGFDLLRGGGRHKEVWANSSRRVGYWTLGRGDHLRGVDDRLLWTAMRLRYRWRDSPTVV